MYPDLTQRSAMPDLGLHCLPRFQIWETFSQQGNSNFNCSARFEKVGAILDLPLPSVVLCVEVLTTAKVKSSWSVTHKHCFWAGLDLLSG